MSNGGGFAALDAHIARIRDLPGALERAAPALASDLQVEIRKDLAAGRSPDGETWAPRKDDGGRAYAGAAGAVSVASSGTLIVATLSGPELYGHRGVRGAEPRRMLPTSLSARVVARWRERIGAVLAKHFRR